jgi:hypothetical protein
MVINISTGKTRTYRSDTLFLFSAATCFDCIRQPSSVRHQFTKRIKMERPILTNCGVKLVEIYTNQCTLGDPGVDGRIVLRWIFRKWDVGVWTRSGWLRIGTGVGHF